MGQNLSLLVFKWPYLLTRETDPTLMISSRLSKEMTRYALGLILGFSLSLLLSDMKVTTIRDGGLGEASSDLPSHVSGD